MSEKNIKLALVIIELILKYGAAAVVSLIKGWEVENPTIEDIEALGQRVPRPETYFEKDRDRVA